MDNYGPFAQKAKRLEMENEKLLREMDMLKKELYNKDKFLDDALQQLNQTKEEYIRMQNELYRAQNIANNYKIADDDMNECNCQCPGCIWKKNPLRELDHAEYKLQDILQQNECMKRKISILESESDEWENFCYRLYGIASSSLQYFPEYPKNDVNGRRRIVMNLVRKMCKFGSKEIDEHAAFESLKAKYVKTTNSIRTIHEEADTLHDILSPDDFYSYSSRRKRINGEITRIERTVFGSPAPYEGRTIRERKEFVNTNFTTNRNGYQNKIKNEEYVSPQNITAMINQTENSIKQKSKQLAHTKSFEQDVKQLHSITKQLKSDYLSLNSRAYENASNAALNTTH